MKKKLLALAVLSAVTLTVSAAGATGFTPIYYMDSGATLSIDKDTIKPVTTSLTDKIKSVFGGPKANRTVWQLINTPNPMAPFRSAKSFIEVNCNTRQTNTLSLFSYDGLNGEGQVLFSSSDLDSKWQYTAPNTAGDALVTAVCSK